MKLTRQELAAAMTNNWLKENVKEVCGQFEMLDVEASNLGEDLPAVLERMDQDMILGLLSGIKEHGFYERIEYKEDGRTRYKYKVSVVVPRHKRITL